MVNEWMHLAVRPRGETRGRLRPEAADGPKLAAAATGRADRQPGRTPPPAQGGHAGLTGLHASGAVVGVEDGRPLARLARVVARDSGLRLGLHELGLEFLEVVLRLEELGVFLVADGSVVGFVEILTEFLSVQGAGLR